MKYKYNKNGLPTREKDVVEAIDTAATTNDEQNRDRFLDFELDKLMILEEVETETKDQ